MPSIKADVSTRENDCGTLLRDVGYTTTIQMKEEGEYG